MKNEYLNQTCQFSSDKYVIKFFNITCNNNEFLGFVTMKY